MSSKMSFSARQEMLKVIRTKYNLSGGKAKSKILDGFVAATGYGRKYAIHLLSKGDQPSKKSKRGRKPKYDAAVKQALLTLWNSANQICSKRLVPFIPELLKTLEKYGHLSLPDEVREKVLSISISSVDRLLKKEYEHCRKGMSTTKPGSLLKKQIKIRTFSDWDDVIPGFMEADLVAHCGYNVEGCFLNTLVLTDIASTWTEPVALLQRSSANVINGLNAVRELLPFPLLGFDSDNGSEFINYDLLEYCEKHNITFTRSRAYRKNDQAHVEEKNGSIVRRLIGYDRYEGHEAYYKLSTLYGKIRLYINFFQPSLKLLAKQRVGSKIIKKYDDAKTPYQRLINSSTLNDDEKQRLITQYETLDPVELLNKIEILQAEFWKLSWKKSSEGTAPVTMPQLPNDEKPKAFEEASTSIGRVVEDADSQANHSTTEPKSHYRRTSKPWQPRGPVTWRTRKDPFEHVWNNIRLQLEIQPNKIAKTILNALMLEYPDQFHKGHLRTLQRRVAEWRKEHLSKEKDRIIQANKEDQVTAEYLSVTITT